MSSNAGITVADLICAARAIAEDGVFSGFDGTVPYGEIDRLFAEE